MTLASTALTVQLNPSISILIKPITQEFGWPRSTIASAATIGTFAGGLLAIAIGPLVDRYGTRCVLVGGFLLMGGALIGLGFINKLWQLYAVFITTRMMLQGVIQLADGIAIAKWFNLKRGRAIGITNLGAGIANAGLPILIQSLVSGFGWRIAVVAMGAFALTLTVVPIAIWMRRQPEDMGLKVDGSSPAGQAKRVLTKVEEPEASFSLREVLHTRAFYILVAITTVHLFSAAGVNFNLQPLLTDQGLSPTQAALVASLIGFIGIPSAYIAGYLCDRFSLRPLVAIAYVGLAVAIAILAIVDSLPLALLYGVIYGVFFASALLMYNLVFANYFGRRHLGAIRGVAVPIQMAGNAGGPLAASFVFDLTGSYTSILVVAAVMMVLAAIAMLFAPKPKQRQPA